jgi:hypothetical protein
LIPWQRLTFLLSLVVQTLKIQSLPLFLINSGGTNAVYALRYEAKQNPDGTKEIIKVEKPYRGRPYVFKRAQFVGDLAVSFKTEVLPDASGGVQATSPDWKTAAANDQAGEQETLPF